MSLQSRIVAFISVSILQAVRTVATKKILKSKTNLNSVSILQAVRTVATAWSGKPVFMRFQKLVLENLKP